MTRRDEIVEFAITPAGHRARIRRLLHQRIWVMETFRRGTAEPPRNRPAWYGSPYPTLKAARAALARECDELEASRQK
jgi:hypothetical protein